MAKTTKVGRLTKVSYMSAGLIIGSMIGGAALASAGWWYSDRLNVAGLFGNTPDVNGILNKIKSSQSKDCVPGTKFSSVGPSTDGFTAVEYTWTCGDSDLIGTVGTDNDRIKIEHTASGKAYYVPLHDKSGTNYQGLMYRQTGAGQVVYVDSKGNKITNAKSIKIREEQRLNAENAKIKQTNALKKPPKD